MLTLVFLQKFHTYLSRSTKLLPIVHSL